MRRALAVVLLAAMLLGGWKVISGPVVPGSHTHGSGLARVYHLWARDGWSGAIYTCSVPRFVFEDALREGWASCAGRYGKW